MLTLTAYVFELPTTEEAVQALIENVGALFAEGMLDRGTSEALNATLDTALRLLTDPIERNDIAAMNALLAFVNLTQGLINGGVMDAADGQPLIDAALAAADAILAGG